MTRDELQYLKKNLDCLISEVDPQTGCVVEDTILKSSFNKKVLQNASELIDRLLILDYNPYRIDKRKKYAFYISSSDIQKVELSDEPITISCFTYKINACIDSKKMKKLKASQITNWLMQKGFLTETVSDDGKSFKVLTNTSASIGISSIKKESAYGRIYDVNVYNRDGQKYILEHINEITHQQDEIL